MSTFIGIGANKIVDETAILLNTLKNEKADLESQVKELTEKVTVLTDEKADLESQVKELTEKSNKKNQKNSDNSEE